MVGSSVWVKVGGGPQGGEASATSLGFAPSTTVVRGRGPRAAAASKEAGKFRALSRRAGAMMPPMRILYVVHQFYPQFVSGTEQYVLALARAGRAAGDDVRVFTVDPDFRNVDPPTETAEYEHLGVPVTRYRFDKAQVRNHVLTDFHNPEVGAAFRKVLAEFQPHFVHAFHLRWVGIDRMTDMKEAGVPFGVHLMDFWYICPNFLLLRPGGELCEGPPDGGFGCFDCVYTEIEQWAREPWAREQAAKKLAADEFPAHDEAGAEAGYAMSRRREILTKSLKQAAIVYSPSQTVKQLLVNQGAPEEPIALSRYAIDWDLIGTPDPPPETITIGFVGTLAPHKGLDVLLNAFRTLEGDLRLSVHGRFGDFPEFDEKVRQLASPDHRVHFAGGFRRDQLREVLGGLHLLVVPSKWRENTPFVCLEGRAAGLPVIASDLDGMSEAVPQGRGALFRTGDHQDLARVLREQVSAVQARNGQRLDPDRSIPTVPAQYQTFREDYVRLGRSK